MTSNLSYYVYIYLDGNSNDAQKIKEAKDRLIQLGPSGVPSLIDGLRKRLREYRSYTHSNAEAKELMRKTLEIIRQGRDSSNIPSDLETYYKKQLDELPTKEGQGISPLQRITSYSSLYAARDLLQELGDGCDKDLCSFLYSDNTPLIMSAALVIYHLDDPSPFVLRSIIASRHLHIELQFLPLQLRMLFYLLFGTLAKNGNKRVEEIIAEDAKAFATDGNAETFMNNVLDMIIYFVSIS